MPKEDLVPKGYEDFFPQEGRAPLRTMSGVEVDQFAVKCWENIVKKLQHGSSDLGEEARFNSWDGKILREIKSQDYLNGRSFGEIFRCSSVIVKSTDETKKVFEIQEGEETTAEEAAKKQEDAIETMREMIGDEGFSKFQALLAGCVLNQNFATLLKYQLCEIMTKITSDLTDKLVLYSISVVDLSCLLDFSKNDEMSGTFFVALYADPAVGSTISGATRQEIKLPTITTRINFKISPLSAGSEAKVVVTESFAHIYSEKILNYLDFISMVSDAIEKNKYWENNWDKLKADVQPLLAAILSRAFLDTREQFEKQTLPFLKAVLTPKSSSRKNWDAVPLSRKNEVIPILSKAVNIEEALKACVAFYREQTYDSLENPEKATETVRLFCLDVIARSPKPLRALRMLKYLDDRNLLRSFLSEEGDNHNFAELIANLDNSGAIGKILGRLAAGSEVIQKFAALENKVDKDGVSFINMQTALELFAGAKDVNAMFAAVNNSGTSVIDGVSVLVSRKSLLEILTSSNNPQSIFGAFSIGWSIPGAIKPLVKILQGKNSARLVELVGKFNAIPAAKKDGNNLSKAWLAKLLLRAMQDKKLYQCLNDNAGVIAQALKSASISPADKAIEIFSRMVQKPNVDIAQLFTAVNTVFGNEKTSSAWLNSTLERRVTEAVKAVAVAAKKQAAQELKKAENQFLAGLDTEILLKLRCGEAIRVYIGKDKMAFINMLRGVCLLPFTQQQRAAIVYAIETNSEVEKYCMENAGNIGRLFTQGNIKLIDRVVNAIKQKESIEKKLERIEFVTMTSESLTAKQVELESVSSVVRAEVKEENDAHILRLQNEIISLGTKEVVRKELTAAESELKSAVAEIIPSPIEQVRELFYEKNPTQVPLSIMSRRQIEDFESMCKKSGDSSCITLLERDSLDRNVVLDGSFRFENFAVVGKDGKFIDLSPSRDDRTENRKGLVLGNEQLKKIASDVQYKQFKTLVTHDFFSQNVVGAIAGVVSETGAAFIKSLLGDDVWLKGVFQNNFLCVLDFSKKGDGVSGSFFVTSNEDPYIYVSGTGSSGTAGHINASNKTTWATRIDFVAIPGEDKSKTQITIINAQINIYSERMQNYFDFIKTVATWQNDHENVVLTNEQRETLLPLLEQAVSSKKGSCKSFQEEILPVLNKTLKEAEAETRTSYSMVGEKLTKEAPTTTPGAGGAVSSTGPVAPPAPPARSDSETSVPVEKPSFVP